MNITRLPFQFSPVETTKKSRPNQTSPLKSGPQKDVFFKGKTQESSQSQKPAEKNTNSPDLVQQLAVLGAPDAATRNKTAFYVSRYFSPNGKTQEYTYGNLLDDSRRMAAAFRKKGLADKRIAVAETNSLDLLNTYYGALATGATVVPLNLLALQDEGTKARVLTHMITGPNCNAFVFGKDPLFKDMAGFKALISIKQKPSIARMVQHYADKKEPQNNWEKLLFFLLNLQMKKKLAAAVAKLEEKGITPSETDKKELATKIRSDFKTLFQAMPKDLQLITPKAKTKLMRTTPLAMDELRVKPNPASLAEIIFTSGTSGLPKGVDKTHANMTFTTQSVSKALDGLIGPKDTILLGLPLFHIFGKATMLTGINRQTPMVLLPSLSAALKDENSLNNVMKTIQEYNVTVLPSVPIFLEKLVAHAQKHPETQEALRNLKVVVSGGSALKKSTYDALKAINPSLQIVEGYGSSEAGINTINSSGFPGYVGQPLPGVDVKLLDSPENPNAGEMLVRSPGVSTRYTEGTLPADKSPWLADAERYFHTGDKAQLVSLNATSGKPATMEDQANEILTDQFQILGRESNFIKDAGGERRAPEEFESGVKQADSRIADAMAIAYKPNRETEKSVVVAVTTDSTVTEESLKKQMGLKVAMGQMPGALVPKHIIVLHRDSLPEAFKNEFKREAGYKAAKSFVEKAVTQKLVTLQDKSATAREKTLVADNDHLQQFAENYRYTG